MAKWVKSAWDAVTAKTIKSGFQKPGLIYYDKHISKSDTKTEISRSKNDCQRKVLNDEFLKLSVSDTDESDFDSLYETD